MTESKAAFTTKYGGRHRVVLIPGDGIGPEMMLHIKDALRHVRAPVEFEEVPLNSLTASEAMIDQAVLAVRRNGVCIKGNIETDHDNPTSSSVNVALRYFKLLLCFKRLITIV